MVRDGNEDISGDIGDINIRLITFIEESLLALKRGGYLLRSAKPEYLACMLFDFHRILFIRLIVEEKIYWKSYRNILRRYISAGLTGEVATRDASPVQSSGP
jgi:hypothetical protein